MLSTLWQTVIGAAAAIVGGLGAALYQTNRADNVARRIRHDERREQALLELDALASGLQARLDGLYRQVVEHGQGPWQYQEALNVVTELAQHWRSKSSGIISDPPIVDAYNALDVAAERLPRGAEYVAFMSNLQSGDPEPVRAFGRDLGQVLTRLDGLRQTVHVQVESLRPREPWWRRSVTTSRATMSSGLPKGGDDPGIT
jgi:hypothetical protein